MGIQALPIRSDHGNDQTVMPSQSLIQLFCQRLATWRGQRFLKNMLGQLHFAGQHLDVLLFEVLFHRAPDQQAEQEQHEYRRQCKPQGQVQRQ